MFIDILEDYRGPKTPEILLTKSVKYLEGQRQLQNLKKQEARRDLLAQNPDLRLKLDVESLRGIIDFSDFKCSPYSSIAKDEAIRGSDIDGGVVVSKARSSLDQQLDFVRAIRGQGFEAYHDREVEDAHGVNTRELRRWNAQERTPGDELPEDLDLAMNRVGAMDSQRILFYSRLQIRRMIGSGRLIMPLIIYLAGFNLDSSG